MATLSSRNRYNSLQLVLQSCVDLFSMMRYCAAILAILALLALPRSVELCCAHIPARALPPCTFFQAPSCLEAHSMRCRRNEWNGEEPRRERSGEESRQAGRQAGTTRN